MKKMLPECERRIYMNPAKLFVVLFCVCTIFPLVLSAQVDTIWVRRYNGPGNGDDGAGALAIDGSGNVYVAGGTEIAGTDYDYVTIKYNANGDTAWVRTYDGSAHDYDVARAVAVDTAGHVYVTGYCYNAGMNMDIVTIKYQPDGDTVWTRTYDGPEHLGDNAYALAIDIFGNVYVTGYSMGSSTGNDVVTIKYTTDGDTVWTSRYDGPDSQSDMPKAIAVDTAGHAYVTGSSYGDILTIKYLLSGDTAWVRTYDGPASQIDYGRDVALDDSGNVYITGAVREYIVYDDIVTIKYTADGDIVWTRECGSPGEYDDEAEAVAVDNQGNVYVAGYCEDSLESDNYVTIKYYSNGDTAWIKQYNGPVNGVDQANDIAVDTAGNAFVTGYSYGAGYTHDYVTIQYLANGDTAWVERYDGPASGSDQAYAIAVDSETNVYVTGSSEGSGTAYDIATIKYGQNVVIEERDMPQRIIKSGFDVYPTPARAWFTIRLHQPSDCAVFKLFDVSGSKIQEIATAEQQTTCRVSLEGIRSGIYFLQKNDELYMEKLIIIE